MVLSPSRPLRSCALACLAIALLIATGCDSDGDEPNDGSSGSGDGDPTSATDVEPPTEADVQPPTEADVQPADTAVAACTDTATHQGEGTFYAADGSGNCSFPATPDDLMVAALNDTDYAESALCGSCITVDGPDGAVTVRVVDRCPGCAPGDVDLSAEAFARIADPERGRVPIEWRVVPCSVDGPVAYHFKDGSNPFWSAVQVRDHRHPVARFEYRDASDAWVEVERVDYNFFVEPAGMGEGPYDFRVTDVYGGVIEDTGIPFEESGVLPGQSQFPACD